MKNIHILPTEKPSKLRVHECGQLFLSINFIYGINDKNKKHIYITCDEEIKEGDWVINLNSPYSHKEICRIDNELELERYAKKTSNNCKKIILTTNQYLIEDGVQAIDDEFLEWFVKNPSCEEVEVDRDEREVGNHLGGVVTEYGDYKTIIPKEEPEQDLEKEMFDLEQELDIPSNLRWHNSKPKQETLEEAKQEGYICPHTKLQCDDECCVSASDCHIKTTIGIISEPKQETLEELKKRFANDKSNKDINLDYQDGIFYGIEIGAKWQQEQDKNKYSEEEVVKFGQWLSEFNNLDNESEYVIKELLRTFKNNKI